MDGDIDKYKSKLQKLQKKKKIKDMKYKIAKKRYNMSLLGRLKKPSTSKIILFIVFLMVIEIICFAEYEMNKLGDLTPMYSLIGIVGVLAPIIKHYYLKATKENTKGGIVYDKALYDDSESVEDVENCSNGDDSLLG